MSRDNDVDLSLPPSFPEALRLSGLRVDGLGFRDDGLGPQTLNPLNVVLVTWALAFDGLGGFRLALRVL